MVSMAKFYDEIKNQQQNVDFIAPQPTPCD
jgi:hypothetical protein